MRQERVIDMINPYSIIEKQNLPDDVVNHIIGYIPICNQYLKKYSNIYYKESKWVKYKVLDYNIPVYEMLIGRLDKCPFTKNIYVSTENHKTINLNLQNKITTEFLAKIPKCFKCLTPFQKSLFQIHKKLDITDYAGFWYTGTIIEYNIKDYMIRVSYDGWASRWDHWIPVTHPYKLAPYLSKAIGGKGTNIINMTYLQRGLVSGFKDRQDVLLMSINSIEEQPEEVIEEID